MKQVLLFIIATFPALNLFGQDKKDLTLSYSTGILNSPYYQKAHARGYYQADFDYNISERHIISANYLAGKHDYYDDVLSNAPTMLTNANGTNSEALYNTFSIAYKYKIINNTIFSIVAGAGAGI